MQSVSDSFEPYAALRNVSVKVNFLGSYSSLSLDTEDIISIELSESLDITCESFPSRSLKLRAVDTLGLSFASLEKDYVGARFEVLIGINGEYVSVGKYYIDEIDTPDLGLTVTIEASDRVRTFMDKYMTGLYVSSYVTMETLVSTASGALSGLDICCDQVTLEAYVYPCMLSTVDSQRDCLLKLAQAAGMASVWVHRDGSVHFERIAGRTGYSSTITPTGVLEYSGLKLGNHTDYVEISGENEGLPFGANWGTYSLGCLAVFLENDFIYGGAGLLVAGEYYESKNQRFELTLKTRCNPALEPGDRVMVLRPDGSELGEFTLTSQTIHFDCDGLWSKLTLYAASPTDG